MTNPATPLDNQAAIAQLSNTIDALVVQFIRPMAQQSIENQRVINENAVAIAETNTGIRDLKASLEASIRISDDIAAESADSENRITENEQRFNTLLADARSDRQKAEENAAKWQANFDAQLAEIRALGEQNRALLSALATTNGRVDNLERAS